MSEQKLNSSQNELIEKNINLAHYIALDYWRRNKQNIEKDEVVTVAYLGLVNAAIRFDPTRPDIKKEDLENGKAFAGFARVKINGAILDWQRTQDHVPKRQRRIYKELQSLGHGEGRTPEELSQLTGMEQEKIRAIIHAVETRDVSIHNSTDHDGNTTDVEIADENHVEIGVLTNSIQRAVIFAFEDLTDIQQMVIVLRYYRGLDLQQISAELGISTLNARTNHWEALAILHAAMKSAATQE